MRGTKLLLLGALILVVGGCASGNERTVTADELDQAFGKARVVYEVDVSFPDYYPPHLLRVAKANARASITVRTPTGTQQSTTGLPMMNRAGDRGLSFEFPSGSFLYISAQNAGEAGAVTCRIKVDDEVVSENTAAGSYAIASCEGSS